MIGCRHHLWIDLEQDQSGDWRRGRMGATTLRRSTMETCALDVADRGGATVDEIGRLIGKDPTLARQIIDAAKTKLGETNAEVAARLRVLDEV